MKPNAHQDKPKTAKKKHIVRLLLPSMTIFWPKAICFNAAGGASKRTVPLSCLRLCACAGAVTRCTVRKLDPTRFAANRCFITTVLPAAPLVQKTVARAASSRRRLFSRTWSQRLTQPFAHNGGPTLAQYLGLLRSFASPKPAPTMLGSTEQILLRPLEPLFGSFGYRRYCDFLDLISLRCVPLSGWSTFISASGLDLLASYTTRMGMTVRMLGRILVSATPVENIAEKWNRSTFTDKVKIPPRTRRMPQTGEKVIPQQEWFSDYERRFLFRNEN